MRAIARSRTGIHPAVGTLESRALLSSVPPTGVAGVAEIRAEKSQGEEHSGKAKGSAGMLQAMIHLQSNPGFDPALQLDFTSGTGRVRPFGAVTIEGNSPSGNLILGASGSGPASGSIVLANSKGLTVGSVQVTGPSQSDNAQLPSQYAFRLIKPKKLGSVTPGRGSTVGSGTLTISFPQGPPTPNGSAVLAMISL